MGCVSSQPSGPTPGTVDMDKYYSTHPGLRNRPSKRLESLVSTRVNSPNSSDDTVIHVKNVDLHITENTKAHRTSEFDVTDASVNKNTRLVVRRGQSFDVTVEFSRLFDANKDDLRFVFQFGKKPLPSKGTHVEFILSDKDEAQSWGGYIVSNEGNCLRVTLVTPPSCYVGKWGLKIDVVKKSDTGTEVYRWSQDTSIYVLFNPWCKDDQVYMPETRLLEEYVLNETGKIYVGTYKKITSRPWAYGQFTGDVLDCCMYLLECCGLLDVQRGNPVVIARKLSGIVNAPDDNGVLVGKWGEEKIEGLALPPQYWTGSAAILELFYKKRKPVKYGQCWVFSGVLTTVCRALGIPARSVTNFVSAHDTNMSLSVDRFFNSKGEEMEELAEDSVWNFHVWNDVWMSRPDLPDGYGGWQVIDATPQETSEGVFCLGPTSVKAIKQGEVHLPYDGMFAFGEVNADLLFWMINDDNTVKLTHNLQRWVGKYVSTKRAFGRATWREMMHGGDPDREDITELYKYKERSDEEQAASIRAHQYSSLKDEYAVYKTGEQDVTFKLTAEDNTFMGQAIQVTLTMKNESSEDRNISGTVAISSIYYTGMSHKHIVSKKLGGATVKPGEELTETVTVEAADYLDQLADHCMYRLSCMCFVKETSQTYAQVDEQRLRKPQLTIKAPDTGSVGQEFEVEAFFENPLPVALTDCQLRVEGPGIQSATVISLKGYSVQPKQTFTKTFSMTPAKPGEREIIVYFHCKQIFAVTESHVINISK